MIAESDHKFTIYGNVRSNQNHELKVEFPTHVWKVELRSKTAGEYPAGSLSITGHEPDGGMVNRLQHQSRTTGTFEYEQLQRSLSGGHLGLGQVNLRVQRSLSTTEGVTLEPHPDNELDVKTSRE